MFCEREMTDALEELLEMFNQVDKTQFEQQHDGDGLCSLDITTHDICEALCDQVRTVYQFTVDSDSADCVCYRGKDLFGQRAAKLMEALKSYADDTVLMEHLDELWLLEDMTFAVVDALFMTVHQGNAVVRTEYRALRHKVQCSDDLCFHPTDYLDSLVELCEEYRDGKQIIYAM